MRFIIGVLARCSASRSYRRTYSGVSSPSASTRLIIASYQRWLC